MPKDILLRSGRTLRDTDPGGLKYGLEEVMTETDQSPALDNHTSLYDHNQLHSHSNKSTLDGITDEGSGQIITTSERNKVAAMDVTHYGTPLQTTVELSAILEADCNDKERRYVEDELSDYFYDVTAVAGDVAPDDQTAGTGFWRKVAVDGETAASIKTKYESNANTNAFTDAEQSKLASITNVGSGVIISAAERAIVNSYTYSEFHTVTAGDITAGFFTLDTDVVDPGGIRIEEVNGVALINSGTADNDSSNITRDWEWFNGNEIHINNNGISSNLGASSIIEGDVLLITYRRN